MSTPSSEPTPSMLLAAIHNIFGRLDSIDGRLDGIDGRLDGIDGRLDGIDGRLDGIDGRLDGVDGRLSTVESRIYDLHSTTAAALIDFSKQNTSSAQLIAAASGDLAALARQLTDHLGNHAA